MEHCCCHKYINLGLILLLTSLLKRSRYKQQKLAFPERWMGSLFAVWWVQSFRRDWECSCYSSTSKSFSQHILRLAYEQLDVFLGKGEGSDKREVSLGLPALAAAPQSNFRYISRTIWLDIILYFYINWSSWHEFLKNVMHSTIFIYFLNVIFVMF